MKLSKRPESSSFRQRIAFFLCLFFLELCWKSLSPADRRFSSLSILSLLSVVSFFFLFFFFTPLVGRRKLKLGEGGFYFPIEELCNFTHLDYPHSQSPSTQFLNIIFISLSSTYTTNLTTKIYNLLRLFITITNQN